MPDRVHQMRLSQTDAAVQEKRIIRMRGSAGHGLRRGVSEAVENADDELFESITSIKVRGTELLKRTRGSAGSRSRILVRLGNGEPQLDAGSEELA